MLHSYVCYVANAIIIIIIIIIIAHQNRPATTLV